MIRAFYLYGFHKIKKKLKNHKTTAILSSLIFRCGQLTSRYRGNNNCKTSKF